MTYEGHTAFRKCHFKDRTGVYLQKKSEPAPSFNLINENRIKVGARL